MWTKAAREQGRLRRNNIVAACAVLAASALFGVTPITDAQPVEKSHRLGYVSFGSLPNPHHEAFRQGMRELGYVEGRNLVLMAQSAQRRRGAVPEVAAAILAAKPDVIVVSTGWTALAVKRLAPNIPIVMIGSSDAVPMGIVRSLSRPGGNVTGLTIISPELAPKRLELLAALPGLRRIAVPWCPVTPINHEELRRTSMAAARLGIGVDPVEYRQRSMTWESLRAAVVRARPDGLFLLDCTSLPLEKLGNFATQQRLPLMSPYLFHAERGALLAYGADTVRMAHRAATFVDKILKGANPADLPVEQPTDFEFAVNLGTARAMGLKLPRSLLVRANRLIQ